MRLRQADGIHAPPEGVVQLELIRLFYSLVFLSSFGSGAAALVAYFALRDGANAIWMDLWIAAILGCKLFEILDAYVSAPRLNSDSPVRRIVLKLMLVQGIDAALWTSLMWIVLDGTDKMDAIIVIAIITGITGGAVSLMSCLMPVMLTYFAVELLVILPKFFLMADPGFHAIAYLTVPYLFAMTIMGGNSHLSSRKSVILRFENQVLNETLRQEVEKSNLAHHAAVQANVAKSRFLAAASHDLRQPIHAVGLFLEALRLLPLNPKEKPIIAPIVENAKTAHAAAVQMLDGLLDFSRIEAEVDRPVPQNFSLQKMLSDLEHEMGILADERQIAYRSRETDETVYADPASVELILRNLISNAIRYTHSGGLLVAARSRGAKVQIEVWDTGIGIAAEALDDIFLEFFQVNNAERDRRNGFGLGLAIASRLATSIGTQLLVASELGRGSKFYFQLPKGQADLVNQSPKLKQNPQCQLGQIDAKGYILLLDDDETVRMGMAAIFDSWGLQHQSCASLGEALHMAQESPPILIISDLRLRGAVNGINAISILRQAAGASIPAVLITGDTAAEQLREVNQSGVRVLHKPVNPNQLAQEIGIALRDD